MKRNATRILAMMVLYNYEMTRDIAIEKIKNIIADEDVHYDEDFLTNLVDGIIENIEIIDHRISVNLKNYTIDRLSYVDRNLIRIGVYEMMKTNTPKSIIINELVDISKIYSEIEEFSSSKFNNSLLDKIAKDLEDGE